MKIKRNFLHILILFFIFYILYFIHIPFSFAQYTTQVSAPSLIIDKMIGIPASQTKGGTLSYVDNLGTADHKFKPGDEVSFQLKVRNATDKKLDTITIQDILPPSLNPLEGPGTYNDKNRTIDIDAGSFAVNEEKIFIIKMSVISQEKLPADKGLFCEINKAVAKGGDLLDDDVSQFCIEKEVVGVQKVPSAGPEMGLLIAGGEMALLFIGLRLKQKTFA